MKMKDMNGNIVKPGDVLIEFGRGGGCDKNGSYESIKVWEVSKINDGRGIEYGTDGSKIEYWRVNVKNSIKLNTDNLPKGFLYSFYHGMSDLNCKNTKGTIQKIIDNSDWLKKKVSEKKVNKYNKDLTIANNLKIRSIDDFKKNFNVIKKLSVFPNNLIEDIFIVHGIKMPVEHSGELGLMWLEIQSILISIMKAYEKELNVPN
jgi:hypothetical protein